MQKAWLLKQVEVLNALKHSESARALGVEDVFIAKTGAIVLRVRNEIKKDWKSDELLRHYVMNYVPYGGSGAHLEARLTYGGWLPALRDEALFRDGRDVEVQCMWVAEPDIQGDALLNDNDDVDGVLHTNPDIVFGWCPGRISKLDENIVHVELERRIVMAEMQIGGNNIRVGKQSPQLRFIG